jgi:hypothetical protein
VFLDREVAMAAEHVARLLDEHDVDSLTRLSQQDVDDYLGWLIQRLDEDPCGPDADRMLSRGRLLHLAGWARADRTLGSLLLQRPTERRLDVVSLLLSQLWNDDRANPPVDTEVLETFIRCHAAVAAAGIGFGCGSSGGTSAGLRAALASSWEAPRRPETAARGSI